jgi:hypothetical protein
MVLRRWILNRLALRLLCYLDEFLRFFFYKFAKDSTQGFSHAKHALCLRAKYTPSPRKNLRESRKTIISTYLEIVTEA